MLHLVAAAGFTVRDLLHPLRYWGYQVYSGIGSDISEVTLLAGAFAVLHHHNCAAPWCWRLGKHPTADGLHRLCARHHPDLPDGGRLSLAQIHERHRQASLRKD